MASIENNTEQLQEILHTVQDLPMAGSSEPDLVIGVNVANTQSKNPLAGVENARYHPEDISIESGSVAAVVEKLKQNKPVRVLMREINFYGLRMWSNGDAEASQVHLLHISDDIEYPETPVVGLVCIFYTYSCPSVANNLWGKPVMIEIAFETNTGSVVFYAATEITCGEWLT